MKPIHCLIRVVLSTVFFVSMALPAVARDDASEILRVLERAQVVESETCDASFPSYKISVPGRPAGRAGDILPNDSGDSEFQCVGPVSVMAFCMCNGENSADCDSMFAACDFAGGLWHCDSDNGSSGDHCYCD